MNLQALGKAGRMPVRTSRSQYTRAAEGASTLIFPHIFTFEKLAKNAPHPHG
jgi:hypothetical protein